MKLLQIIRNNLMTTASNWMKYAEKSAVKYVIELKQINNFSKALIFNAK